MALIAHHMQSSYAAFPVRPRPRADVVKSKPFISFQLLGRADRSTLLKHRFRLSIGGQPCLSPKGKPFKISSFKGSAQNEESDGITSSSKFSKNSVQVSYVPQEKEVIAVESQDGQNIPLSYASGEREDTAAGSPAIQKLFKKWLIMLRTQTAIQTTDEILKENPPKSEITATQLGTTQQRGVGDLLKASFGYFLGLDAAIKFPPLIFIPWYLAINVVYGPEVSKELTPLWVFGPLIVALYIKIVQGLCSLYIFCFKQAIGLVKNLPTYCMWVYNYIAEGKLKAFLWAHLGHPVMNIRNLDYKDLSKRKLKELEEWVIEKYLDYVESIWPYYCRTIRFLKKANLI